MGFKRHTPLLLFFTGTSGVGVGAKRRDFERMRA
jgi:hypothetical protein